MVGEPAGPVQPRHPWNTNRRISSWTLSSLTRHSHHHAQGEAPCQHLRPMPEAPLMINGYVTTIVIAMLHPLWHLLMTPKLLAWDRDHASSRDGALAARPNEESGVAELELAVLNSEGRKARIAQQTQA